MDFCYQDGRMVGLLNAVLRRLDTFVDVISFLKNAYSEEAYQGSRDRTLDLVARFSLETSVHHTNIDCQGRIWDRKHSHSFDASPRFELQDCTMGFGWPFWSMPSLSMVIVVVHLCEPKL